MLDVEHEDLEQAENDPNLYALGQVAGHNVVLACLPAGQTGTVSAAAVATQLMATFKWIRFVLMVGIGGGVPGKEDIRLGDVVVSQPYQRHGGVIQYDLESQLRTGSRGQDFSILRRRYCLVRSVA
jgi:nucleoside phosphorylase